MKNQYNNNMNVSKAQYPFSGILKKSVRNKILPCQKALYFCTAIQRNEFKSAYTSSSFYPPGKL